MIKVDKAKLKTTVYLKKEFVRIDYAIHELNSLISVWYLMPQMLTKHLIINMWCPIRKMIFY
jgi:hypothetical protein